LGPFFPHLFEKIHAGSDLHSIEALPEYTVAVEIDFLTVDGPEKSISFLREKLLHDSTRFLPGMAFHIAALFGLEFLQPSAGRFKSVLQDEFQGPVHFFIRGIGSDHDLRTLRRQQFQADTVGISLSLIFMGLLHGHTAADQIIVRFIQLGRLPADEVFQAGGSFDIPEGDF